MLRAVCAWGDGPDVLLANEGELYFMYNYHKNGSFDLTAEETEDLGRELLEAARQAKELEREWRKHGGSNND